MACPPHLLRRPPSLPFLLPLLLLLLSAPAHAAAPSPLPLGETLPFDAAWRFQRGASPSSPGACSFPVDLGELQCFGLRMFIASNATAAICAAACCGAGPECTTWQLCPRGAACSSGAVPAGSCWAGVWNDHPCNNTHLGWVSRGRNTTGAGNATCTQRFCMRDYDDTAWRVLDVPHDWSVEDLPARAADVETPVLALRNGSWLFRQGDSSAYSAPTFNDSDWQQVSVPHDWRLPPTSYEQPNARAWYRRHFKATRTQQDAAVRGMLRLALGSVASQDTTYINGVQVGSTGGSGCSDFLDYRSYVVPPNVLTNDSNVIAVRVHSAGGPAPSSVNVSLATDGDPTSFPGGLCDTQAPDMRQGAFDPGASAGQKRTGYTVGGDGWYRKHFVLAPSDAEHNISVRFDGVYMGSSVFLNGVLLGVRPYGYVTFEYDMTPHLLFNGSDNVLAVHVVNYGDNSRWYAGSGIYRHVHLAVRPRVHVPLWGLHVQTTAVDLAHGSTTLNVTVPVTNPTTTQAMVHVAVNVTDAGGTVLKTATASVNVAANATASTTLVLAMTGLHSWTLDSPVLYNVVASVAAEGAVTMQRVTTYFGLRTLSFDAQNGFRLNGESLKLQGGCVHHANGPLGAAAIDRADERRVLNLKAVGYNAIRTSHNPVSPAFLDACDRHGMLVMEEAFDCWEQGKLADDYHNYFDEWWQRDMQAMVLRDRNRPSIIMWSIGNEIPMRHTPAGKKLAQVLADYVRTLDPASQRAVTSAVPGVSGEQDDDFFAPLDVAGYNYSPAMYTKDHSRKPNRIIVATESFPAQSFEYWDGVWSNSYVIGDFIWTAIDYLGEASIGANGENTPSLRACSGYCPQGWNYYISFCGDLDVVGLRKPQSYLRSVLWNNSMLEMGVHAPVPAGSQEVIASWGFPDFLQSWTWPELTASSAPLAVNVYTRYPSVNLLLNGEPVNAHPTNVSYATQFTATFTVPYVAGNLTAVAYTAEGQATATHTFLTAGTPTALAVTVDRPTLTAWRSDLAYVVVDIVDAEGHRVPRAAASVQVTVSGAGELAALGSGDPQDTSSFHTGVRRAYDGRVVAIVRPGATGSTAVAPGEIHLVASAAGLASARLTLQVV